MLLSGSMTWTETAKLSSRDRKELIILFGSLRGGEYNAKKRNWDKQPTIM